jgi:hypothetical protein
MNELNVQADAKWNSNKGLAADQKITKTIRQPLRLVKRRKL